MFTDGYAPKMGAIVGTKVLWVITPSGDPISMLALAVPMTMLFVIAILIGFIAQWRKKKRSPIGE